MAPATDLRIRGLWSDWPIKIVLSISDGSYLKSISTALVDMRVVECREMGKAGKDTKPLACSYVTQTEVLTNRSHNDNCGLFVTAYYTTNPRYLT